MHHYTVHCDPDIDALIQSHMDTITRALRARFGKRLHAIVLIGGFGRGEGSVLRQSDTVQPLNDYDLMLIGNWPRLPADALTELATRLKQELGIRFVDLAARWRFKLRALPPNMFNYDMRYGHHIIYGPARTAEQLPDYTPSEVSPHEGLTQIANRLITPLELMTRDSWDAPQCDDVRIIIQIGKLVTAVADDSVICAGQYDHLYANRATHFDALVQNSSRMTPFREFIADAYRYKLRPETLPAPLGARDYFNTTCAVLAQSLNERTHTKLADPDLSELTAPYAQMRTASLDDVAQKTRTATPAPEGYVGIECDVIDMLAQWTSHEGPLTSHMLDDRDALIARWMEVHH